MGIWDWLAQNWFNIFGTAGIAGLWLMVVTIKEDIKARRVANLFAAIQNHRELWSDYYHRPELARVLDSKADVVKKPPTREEEGFVKLVIQHTNGVFQAMRNGLVIEPEGVRRDVASFFSLPIPWIIWERVKLMQNDDFVEFVEKCRNWK